MSRKARCSLRGDLKAPGTHFESQRTQCLKADKRTARLLFEISATHKWPVDHQDITNAYGDEPAIHKKPIYVREISDIRGWFTHGKNGSPPENFMALKDGWK